jgi:nucleotide-binding universal stress UspA family protein
MKILIGIDGSEHSFAAAEQAGRLLSAGRDRVALYHACAPIELGNQMDESLRDRACQAVANVIFDEARKRLPGEMQAQVELIQGEGDASAGMIEAAQRSGAEMVVVGARGLGRMQGLLVGSVSSNVVRKSQLPVLVVRGKPAEPGALRLLLAYDMIHAEQHAAFLNQLTWPAEASGQVAAVIDSMLPVNLPDWVQTRARDADTEAMSQAWVQEHEQDRQAKQQELNVYVATLPSPFRAHPPSVIEGNPAEQLLALARRERPSIIIVGKAMKNLFDRWFIGSVSEKILAHADCSVLVIPARKV